ncbi:MAG: cytochrome c3 family protein [Proteobacteria bacterium]|nr:cytochrome c3 family protein [Pseudomonadota bacterium]
MLKKILLLAFTFCVLSVVGAGAAETKNIKFTFKYADPVVFSHEFHLKKYNNNCRMCHDAIFNLRDKKHYTMAEMEKTKSCGACHSGVKAFSVASDKDCTRCHTGKPQNVSYPVKSVGSVLFSHTLHIAKTGGSCKACHNGKIITGKTKTVTMAEMEKGRTCGACHNGKRAFAVTANCDRCHKTLKPKEIIFSIKGVTPATFSHTFHTGVYGCKDCHTKTFPFKAVVGKSTMADMAKGKSCGTCHNGTDAFAATGDCNKCHKGMKPKTLTFKDGNGTIIGYFSHAFHTEMYKCSDCHTKIFPYSSAKRFTMKVMETGSACGACHNGSTAFSVKGDCLKCHGKKQS